jgi:aminoglycoside phosphotransferase (APT) family kinase protein
MQPLRHGYTNDTRGDGRVVMKRYEGPDRSARHARERMVLARLQGLLPVPALLHSGEDGELRMQFAVGVHGQELIEAGMAGPVLRACGRMLRRIHQLDIADVLPGLPHPPGAVLVHGDYGPNNVLLDPGTFAITAVMDWEWAHPGQAVEDLAWCEWIIRMHHSAHVQVLDRFFDAYGQRPPWDQRQAAMLAQCQRLVDMCRRWSTDAVRVWQHRLHVTADWVE